MSENLRILETTLRDGSYSINFSFTANDTAVLAKGLENLGFKLIEIGHGVGLGASKKGYGEAAESDEDYLKAASESLTSADFGMFCIPGIASLEDIDLAAEYNMGFIRVGTDVTKIKEGQPYIERAKKHGMFVSTNYMKSYCMPPKEFAQQAIESQKYGADILCVVDSAGGMMRSELEAYFNAVQDVCDIPLGFHGHDNLGLATSNSLRAVEMGAVVVDTSLQGMGRSAGNASTEHVVAGLVKMGIDLGIDLIEVMDLGEKYIKPMMTRTGLNSLDIICGFSQFHSSYMGVIRKYASKYSVDPRRLIMRVCEVDKVNAPEDLVERLAHELSNPDAHLYLGGFGFDKYHGDEQR